MNLRLCLTDTNISSKLIQSDHKHPMLLLFVYFKNIFERCFVEFQETDIKFEEQK